MKLLLFFISLFIFIISIYYILINFFLFFEIILLFNYKKRRLKFLIFTYLFEFFSEIIPSFFLGMILLSLSIEKDEEIENQNIINSDLINDFI